MMEMNDIKRFDVLWDDAEEEYERYYWHQGKCVDAEQALGRIRELESGLDDAIEINNAHIGREEVYLKRIRELEAENKRLGDNQVWYSNALEVLSKLRFHTNQLIEDVVIHNRFVDALQAHDDNTSQSKIALRSLECTQKASRQAESFFTR